VKKPPTPNMTMPRNMDSSGKLVIVRSGQRLFLRSILNVKIAKMKKKEMKKRRKKIRRKIRKKRKKEKRKRNRKRRRRSKRKRIT